MAGWIKLPLWYRARPWPRRYCVNGNPAPPKKAHSPHFLAHVYCGHMAGWIKMPLGTKVGLGPGHIVLHGDPAPPKNGHSSPQFSAHVRCGQMAGWTEMPLGMEVGLGSGAFVLDWDRAPPPPKKNGGTPTHPVLSPCIVSKWLDESKCHLVGR